MQAIVRKRQTRKLLERGKAEQVYILRGSEVKTQKIDRWMKRHDITDSMLYAPSPVASMSEVMIRRVCLRLTQSRHAIRSKLSYHLSRRLSDVDVFTTSSS
jgi:hypothetical protein